MSYLYESSDFCRQSEQACQVRMEQTYRACQASEGEVLAYEVATCDDSSGRARVDCLEGALGRFTDRLDGCLG